MSSINHYSIGWICAIDTEIIAAEMMFDELLGRPADIASNDVNSYSFGRISEHHIVVACLPHSQCKQFFPFISHQHIPDIDVLLNLRSILMFNLTKIMND